MNSRVLSALLVATLVAVLLVPGSAAAASEAYDLAMLSAGEGGGDLPAVERFRSVLSSSGLSRTDTDGVLDQPTRAAVYTTIQETPGVTLAGLAAAVGVTKSTVRYHTDVLRDAGLVEATELAGALRFAPAETDVELAAALNADATGAVIDAVAEHEPASVTALAEATDRAPSTVSHHLSALEERGLVERERVGEAVVTTLAAATRRAVTEPVAIPDGG